MIPSPAGLLQAFSLFAVAILLARPLGGYMRAVMEGENASSCRLFFGLSSAGSTRSSVSTRQPSSAGPPTRYR
jgi:K+-transporting ATPase A subunit